MLRAIALAAFAAVLAQGAVQDGRSALYLAVSVTGPDGKPLPVPRHVLLVSDNPPTGVPRRLRTALDGTASVRLPPGSYIVESDQPVELAGRTYQWTQLVDVPPGRDVSLELTGANAEVSAAPSGTPDAPASREGSASSLLLRWRDSVVAVWSATARASGFLADERGLVVTSQRALGAASSAEVEIAPAVKVTGRVLAADAVRDVAVLWIDPQVASALTPVPLECAGPAASVDEGEEVVAIQSPLRGAKDATASRVDRIEGRSIAADLVLAPGGTGGPVFGSGGRLVGISSMAEEDGSASRVGRVIRLAEVCASVAAAGLQMKEAAPPPPTLLPREPERAFPAAALAAAAGARTVTPDSYRVATSSYDVTFITPVLAYAARNQPREDGARSRTRGRAAPDPRTIDPLGDFSNWSAYVAEFPPVLMIRATPKLVEGFWTKIARGAAQAQGAAIPPIRRFKPGFLRMQAFCGEAEVAPVHPFRIEQRVSESEAIYEGLYVFDPEALGPSCATVRLVLYSERDPQKGEARVVDPAVLRRVWDDFAPYRQQ
jgi:S1-C subfamily serine protease